MNYLSFKEFVDKYGLKDEATSNIKIQQILNTLHASGELHLPTKVYMRDDTFSTDSGIVNLHPTKGTHWVLYTNKYFDSYGCPPPTNINRFLILNHNNGIYSEYQIQTDDVIVQHIVCMCYISQI